MTPLDTTAARFEVLVHRAAELAKELREDSSLPSTFKFVGAKVEHLFDPGNRHKSGKKPIDYLKSWSSMLRPFAYATRDDSWGEMEKLLCIVMRNYVDRSRQCGVAADLVDEMKNALPALLSERRALKEEVERLRAENELLHEQNQQAHKAVADGVLGNLLDEDEKTALAQFTKFMVLNPANGGEHDSK